jgi:hypothetical protein
MEIIQLFNKIPKFGNVALYAVALIAVPALSPHKI